MYDSDSMEVDTPTQKRVTNKDATTNTTNGRKSKSVATVSVMDMRLPRYWLGFSYMEAMEQIAIDRNLSKCTNNEPLEDLMAKGYIKTEAKELLQATIVFPRVPHILYPLVREDKVLGQHFNLTQIPFEVETHLDIGLSFYFHVTIFFEKPKTTFEHDVILDKAHRRFEEMSILLGTNVLHPISVLCKNRKTRKESRTWVGILKAHLLKPEVHGIELLRGTKPFIFRLDDDELSLEKVAKGYDTIAKNNLFFVKFTSKSPEVVTAHSLFNEVLEDNFYRKQEYEIIGVQKNASQDFTWIVAPTPN